MKGKYLIPVVCLLIGLVTGGLVINQYYQKHPTITKPTSGQPYNNPRLKLSMLIPKDWSVDKPDYADAIFYPSSKRPKSGDYPNNDAPALVAFPDGGNPRYYFVSENNYEKFVVEPSGWNYDSQGWCNLKKVGEFKIANHDAVELYCAGKGDEPFNSLMIWFRKDKNNYVIETTDLITYYSEFRPYLTTISFSK